MAVQDTIASMNKHTQDAYDKIEEKGGELPVNKNLANLATAIRSIPGGGGWDPSNPTLDGLQDALDKGEDVLINTEIPDTWNGVSNPLVVGINTIIEKGGQRYKAIGLVRKYADPTTQVFGSTNDYSASPILSYLNNDYLSKCSEALKNIISEVEVGSYNGSTIQKVSGKVHLFSGIEVGGTAQAGEGEFWPYWKQKTGLSAADNTANSGRIVNSTSGAPQYWWLRSRGTTSPQVSDVTADGQVYYGAAPNATIAVLPQFWVLASNPLPQPSVPTSLAELKQMVNEGKEIAIGTEIEDTYNGGTSFKWRVLHQGYATLPNNNRVEGVYIMPSFVENVSARAGSSDYSQSNTATNLSAWFEKFNDTTKSLITEINVPCYTQSSQKNVNAKIWALSATELYGSNAYSNGFDDGFAFDYFKKEIGANPTNNAAPSRVLQVLWGGANAWRTRSNTGDSSTYYVTYQGTISSVSISTSTLLAGACFISAD